MKTNLVIVGLLSFMLVACGDSNEAEKDKPVQSAEPEVTTPVTDTPEQQAPGEVVEEVAAVEPAPVEEAPVETVAESMSGEQVFKKHCFACHMTGAANAPKVGDAEAWGPRIEKGMDVLLQSAIEGIPGTAMAAKGTCYSCSEEELQAAIEFMVHQIQ